MLFAHLVLKMNGHNVVYLGQNLPYSSLLSLKEKNKIDNILFFVFSNKVISQNFLMVESQQGFPDETNIFQILLINNDPVKAIQFDVELPNNFELDINNVTITDRTAGFNVAASYLSGTTYRVILYSISNLLLSPGDLSIITFPVLIEDTVTPGVYFFNFEDVIISDANNQNISSVPLENGEITILSLAELKLKTLSLIHI